MIDGLKPYPAMKDSGVPWLGQVPEHWQVSPAFAVYRPRQVKNTGLVESTVLSLSYGRIIVKAPEKLRGLVPESFETYQIVEPGNIIVRTTDLQNDQTSLRVGHAHHRGIITAAYMCLETKPIVLNEFGYQYLNAYDLLKIIYGLGSGLRQNLDFSDIKRMPVLVPPPDEQAAIVRFLDHADRRIRRYIRAKQKLIKLLEEQKQAIIHRAVTRGLDPNVRLKPSGVEWLGDVPEHWEVRRVLSCLEGTRAGIWGDDPTPANEADHVTCLRVADFDMSRLSIHGSKLTKRAVPASLRNPRLLAAGDILMEKSGGGETEPVGRVVLYDENVAPHAICSNFIVRLRPNATTEPKFLLHVLAIMQVTRRNVPCIKQTTGIQNLDERAYLSLAIGVPPLVEQQAIIASLTNRLRPIDKAASRARREIDLLREYRTRLIADVVTGKLDVREAAARLPDEAEELEPVDEIEAEGDTDEACADDTDEVPEEIEA